MLMSLITWISGRWRNARIWKGRSLSKPSSFSMATSKAIKTSDSHHSLSPSLPLPPSFPRDSRSIFGLFFLPTRKASVYVLDRGRTNQITRISSIYQVERTSRLARFQDYPVPPAEFTFDVHVETEMRKVRGKTQAIHFMVQCTKV